MISFFLSIAECKLGVVSTAIENLGTLLPPQNATTPSPPDHPQWYKPSSYGFT